MKSRAGQWLWDNPELRSIYSQLNKEEREAADRARGQAKKGAVRAKAVPVRA